MTKIDVEDSFDLNVFYELPVDVTRFTPSTFKTNPGLEPATAVVQIDDHKVALVFGADISGSVSVTYNGTVPNILTPQTQSL